MALKVGDQVVLKSGGPSMTVNTIQDDGKVWCVWFNQVERTWEIKGHSFNQDTLRSLN